MKELIQIQQKLRSRKDKAGDGGRFKYRSAEDILEAVKPLLVENNCAVVLSDSIFETADHVLFLKSTATLLAEHTFDVKDDDGKVATYKDSKEIARADGFAQLDSHIVLCTTKDGKQYEKKTMSNEQCTGSASSYARKYALCGLFAIDDSDQDPDGMSQEPTLLEKIASAKDADDINALLKDVKAGTDAEKKAFNAQVANLLLVFDKSAGKYVPAQKQ